MQKVWLCYEMNSDTGLSEVTEVTIIEDYAKDFFKYYTNAHRVEEFYIDGHKEDKALIKIYSSIEDWE